MLEHQWQRKKVFFHKFVDFVDLQATIESTTNSTGSTDFAVIAVHSQPKNAAEEIDSLDDVTKWTKDR
jgi:hypothetical protein